MCEQTCNVEVVQSLSLSLSLCEQTCNVEVVQSEHPEVFEKEEILLSSSSTLRAVRVSLFCQNDEVLAILSGGATLCARMEPLA